MGQRLKFYGWGFEDTGLTDAERDHLFRFVAGRLGVEPRLSAPPQVMRRLAGPLLVRGSGLSPRSLIR
ncbi:hypothetical protein [Roseiarcus sp.]|uniref:hypothetical protein n=1 Tax=Roseiarcus sp. TaxID=1969460 RepID=UPI003D0999A5